MNHTIVSLLIVLLPLASFLLLSIFGKKFSHGFSGLIGTLSLGTVTILSLYMAAQYFFGFGQVNGVYTPQIVANYQWLTFTDNLFISMGVVIDQISVMMLVVISVVSLMVHIYSINYMHNDERFTMYYAYLSLFTFSMLGLVISVNIFQMYIFWELVGVSSFLLIGYYYQKPEAIAAAKKAFIVTRFADLGFLIGILILSYGAQTMDFFTMIERFTNPESEYLRNLSVSFMGGSVLTWGLMLVFIGGAGKSAMFPLHIWLPDAMEGPTPVSALIHAATMVVAGVFLVARLFPIFAISAPEALTIIAYIGAITALFAAIIACTQTDIKRVLAYSTISQIGFMMFALGVAGWGAEHNEGFTAGLFHLFTHAFFKALLFLGAGAIIHAVHSNEMKDMGGLRKKMPITHITFLIACLAIAGIPPFAGFFSKEAILSSAFHSQPIIFYMALFTSALTSFYMFRLYFNIFWKKEIGYHQSKDSHESHTWYMNIALIILAVGSALVGLIPFGHFVSAEGLAVELPFHITFSIAPVVLGITGIAIASFLYMKQTDRADRVSASFGSLYKWAYSKFYIDEIYIFITKKVVFNLIGRPAAWLDKNVVDGMMNGSAWITTRSSEAVKGMQSGRLQSYAMYFLGGVLAIVAILIWK